MASPGKLENALRSAGKYRDIYIKRDLHGKVDGVQITTTDNLVLDFFPNRESCEEFRDEQIVRGKLASPEELQ
jgi:hypothetical protein